MAPTDLAKMVLAPLFGQDGSLEGEHGVIAYLVDTRRSHGLQKQDLYYLRRR